MPLARETIRRRRLELGLSATQLGAAVGVSAASIHNWERGGYVPLARHLPPLARALSLPVDALLDGVDAD